MALSGTLRELANQSAEMAKTIGRDDYTVYNRLMSAADTNDLNMLNNALDDVVQLLKDVHTYLDRLESCVL